MDEILHASFVAAISLSSLIETVLAIASDALHSSYPSGMNFCNAVTDQYETPW